MKSPPPKGPAVQPSSRHTTSPMLVGRATLRALGTDVHVLATRPEVLPEALHLVRDYLATVDRAMSRFRPDSEVCRLAEHARSGPVQARLSETAADYLAAALDIAALTDGIVDPTVGAAVIASGYDADIAVVRERRGSRRQSSSGHDRATLPGWRSVRLVGRDLALPQWCVLDVGATGKAHAADRLAAALMQTFPGGFLVDLGGDVALGGPHPPGGWRVAVEPPESRHRDHQVVTITTQAVATSSTHVRTWDVDGTARHHIVDPRTGMTAPAIWSQVTCVATSALLANAASTAAIVLGEDAPAWLAARGIPARLDRLGEPPTLVGDWPDASPFPRPSSRPSSRPSQPSSRHAQSAA